MMTVRSDSVSSGSKSALVMRSASACMAMSILSAGKVSKYLVESMLVKAFHCPPARSISRSSRPAGKRGVPLNIICSTQCEMPVRPVGSLRLPTR